MRVSIAMRPAVRWLARRDVAVWNDMDVSAVKTNLQILSEMWSCRIFDVPDRDNTSFLSPSTVCTMEFVSGHALRAGGILSKSVIRWFVVSVSRRAVFTLSSWTVVTGVVVVEFCRVASSWCCRRRHELASAEGEIAVDSEQTVERGR